LAADDGARRHARAVDDLLRSQGRAPGLQTVMQYLGNGMSRDLVRHALPDDLDADTVTEATAAVIGGYLSAALLAGGGTEHRLDWSRGAVLVDRSGEVLDASELVAEVMATPARAGELDELLRLTGASPTFRAEDGPASGPRERDPETAQVLGVLSPVNRADTFVVHEDGLLLLPEKVWQRHLAGPAPVTVAALMSARGARDVPWDQVELVRLVHLAGGRARIICSVVGDEDLVVKVGPRSGEGGAPYAVMRSRLEKRYRIEERIGTRM
jgi:hypothetical protein